MTAAPDTSTASATVRVRLRSFGPLRGVFAGDRDLPAGSTVGDLLLTLREESARAAQSLEHAAVALNGEYARKGDRLSEGDEVAILPPVSGGSDDLAEPVRLTFDRIDVAAEVDAVRDWADGAIVTFDGVVRNNTRGRATLHLEYEAYEQMALAQMQELRAAAIAQFGVRDVRIVHRLGKLLVGETSVLIVVGSAHRGVAFDACRWVIDTLKKQVPIWKLEQFVDGAAWAAGEPFPESIAEPLR